VATKTARIGTYKRLKDIGRLIRRNSLSKKLRNHDEVVIEQLLNPEMAKAYLDVALEEYEQDGNLAFFLEALRNAVEAQEDAPCGKNGFEPPESLPGLVVRRQH